MAKRRKKDPTEPTPIAEALERSPAVATLLASREESPREESPREAPPEKPAEPVPSHAARILAERPTYRQAPEEYFRVASHEREGIRVFKNTIIKGGQKLGVAAVQFAENRQPTRAEKDYLLDRDFRYKIEENLWKLQGKPGEALGDPTIAVVRTAGELAEGRKELGR